MYTGFKNTCNFLLTFIFITLWSASAHATIVPPTGYDADNGAGLFTPGSVLVSIEAFDLVGTVAPPNGTVFGFYFSNNTAINIPIFTHLDQATAGGPPIAAIDFINGKVLDVDNNNLVVQQFTGSGNIGFYIQLGNTAIYTDPSRNTQQVDIAAVFPKSNTPYTYMLGFEGYNNGIPFTLALEVVAGVKAIIPKPIPEPQILLLMLGGLLTLALRRRGIS